MQTKLRDVMTPRERLIIAKKSETIDKNNLNLAVGTLRRHNLDTSPILDDNGKVVALVTDSDIRKQENYPLATKDENNQLKVFIAVESRIQLAQQRIKKAFEVGIDGIVVDASIVFREQLGIAKWTKENFPKLEVVLGNVDSAEMVETIIKRASKYCDALRVGVGPGAACITR